MPVIQVHLRWDSASVSITLTDVGENTVKPNII